MSCRVLAVLHAPPRLNRRERRDHRAPIPPLPVFFGSSGISGESYRVMTLIALPIPSGSSIEIE